MSDFSELCPLFETGVFKEILFPRLVMTLTAQACNALEGSCTAGALATKENFTFGRTVVITNAYIRKWTANAVTCTIHLDHRSTAGATPTIFGTATIFMTATAVSAINPKHTWQVVTVDAKTFTSSEVLGVCIGGGTTSSGGEYDLLIRYKEK
jgi:hypothetical protein